MSTKNGKQQKPVADEKSPSFFRKALLVLLFNIETVVVIAMIKFAYQFLQPQVYVITPLLKGQEWNLQTKIDIISTIGYFFSLFLIGCVVIITLARSVSFRLNPVQQTDSVFVGTMNRTLSNSVEQALIFFPLYAYFLFKFATAEDKEYAILLGLQWIVGRILFTIGYMFIYVNLPTLRGTGFSLGLLASVELACRVNGISLVAYLQKIPIPL